MKILTWFWNNVVMESGFRNQGAKCRVHRKPFKTWSNIKPKSKISPVLQNTPTGTPRVSKNSQKYFTNKYVEVFLLKFIPIWNNIEKTSKRTKKTPNVFRFFKISGVQAQFRFKISKFFASADTFEVSGGV